MKKIIFGVFAHPDDEAFMVAGTLLKETQAGAELHLICLTDGAAGTNLDKLADLGDVRLQEWRVAGRLLGASSMHHLGFRDGELDNTDMLQAAAKIETIVREVSQANTEPITIEFVTFDLSGLTGHIDHIVTSRAAALAFYRLKSTDSRMDRLRLACLPLELYPHVDIDWLYMESGRSPSEIDEVVDTRTMRSQILAIIHAHHTQRQDGEAVIRTFGDQLGMNYFVVKK